MEIHGNQALHALHLSTTMLVNRILLFSIIVSILWLHSAICLSNLGNETDRLALLEFKSQIGGGKVLSSWNDSVHFCSWKGVTCSLRHHQRVTSLDLIDLSLSGTISPYIGNLSFLKFINLCNNKVYGEIPREVGRLFRLRYLNLTENILGGEIPVNISYCSKLDVLDVGYNRLIGRIPVELGCLNKLVLLYVNDNKLTGEIPHSFGNLSSLKEISVAGNNMEGTIPNELGQLTDLTIIAIGENNFTGTIPSMIYNISSLTLFSVADNDLHGRLPPTIGLTLPNLVRFGFGWNQFDGIIPASLTNASFLELFDIARNKFVGQVPNNLGVLKDFKLLNLEENFLGSNTSEDLNFLTSLSNCSNLQILSLSSNNFGGTLPSSVANLSINLEKLFLGGNQIFGRIPAELSNLVKLYVIALEENHFSGTIPTSFGKLSKLQELSLSKNLLSGEIPSTLGNLSLLYALKLDGNQLEGNITSSIGKCQVLEVLDLSTNKFIGGIPPQIIGLSSLSKVLNLSQNSLTGSLPQEVSNLESINALDVSENQISGKIPGTIGECLGLEIFKLQGNALQGSIPSSIVSLRGLQLLDLSRNNLSGNIPKELEEFKFLQYLNLSCNNLWGEVPTKGVFSNTSAFSVIGNRNLCGGVPELQLPKCIIKQRKHNSHAIMLVAVVVSPILVVMALTSLYIFYKRKSRKNPLVISYEAGKLFQVSYKELFDATQGFSSDSLIGQGSFGSVYKGRLQQLNKIVAVKVLNLQQEGASKSFIAECKALRNVRHRNLVKILTYCSIQDFRGNEFKALVFDYMANGSLEMWLHPPKGIGDSPPRSLNLIQRLSIAIDVAFALHYLHDNCEIPIIHCDLKPSNILLDDDMISHVGDFGLARLVSISTNTSSQSLMSSIGIKGSIGYIAPEYGMGSEATTNGDVYSYGIILLEMFTGKRPTDEAFTDTSSNLHNIVKAALKEGVMQVVDPELLNAMGEQEVGSWTEIEIREQISVNKISREKMNSVQMCILSMLKIGLACSEEFPRERMSMRDALRELIHAKDAFLGIGSGGRGGYTTNING